MFENIVRFFKKIGKKEKENSKTTAKERLHLVLAQDRANISADFLDMMKQEIIEVIKKYVDIDEGAIDVRMTNKSGEDGTVGAPALYANIPIVTIRNEARKLEEDKVDNEKEEEEIIKDTETEEIDTTKNIDESIKTDTLKQENNDKDQEEKVSETNDLEKEAESVSKKGNNKANSKKKAKKNNFEKKRNR